MIASDTHIHRIQKLSVERNDEKNDLQQLNDSLGIYIQQVKELELRNNQLRSQIIAQKPKGGFDSDALKKQYNKDLLLLRQQLDTTAIDLELAQLQKAEFERATWSNQHRISFLRKFFTTDKQRLSLCTQEIERNKAELDGVLIQIENKKHEVERTKSVMNEQSDYLENLEKEYNEIIKAHVVINIQLKTLQEESFFLKAVFEEEYEELLSRGTLHIDVSQFYLTELSRAIANIRKDYQTLSNKRQQEWETYYQMKTEEIKTEIIEQTLKQKSAKQTNDVGTMDVKTLKVTLEEFQSSYTALQSENVTLISHMQTLEEQYGSVQFERHQSLFLLEQQIAALLADYNEGRSKISSIHESNVTLQFEISTYRRLLEGVSTSTSTKTREIALQWASTSTANFSAMNLKAPFVLHWAETVKVTGSMILLPTTFIGPKGCSGVSFAAIYYTSNERVIVEATITDQFNFNNYGQYQVTIYYVNSKVAIGSWTIQLEPKGGICMPKQLLLRDSINNSIVGATVQLLLLGQIAFQSTSDKSGIVNLPKTLSENCYDIQIDAHTDKYKIGKFKRIVFQNRGAESETFYIYRQMKSDEVEFLLTWGEKPSDLDSHVYVSDGRHVSFLNKQETNVSLDYDCREGGGPETTKVKLEPNMKYIYAVHRYTKDGELAKSKATVNISTNEDLGSGLPFHVVRVPNVNQPDANFWVVCQIDGTTKKIKYFENAFENRDECNTDEFIRKFYNA
ncbi:unnamed protein product [Rotaria magnacalcarata]|uniref:IF rod domain-containing protein n=1 Tax=Rotaria magnacalcarata TaxID=392030 RepID=A0A816QXT9_9BILA|nr:unnamed protein product [Rotaria magnacalcarata]CAF3872777.1 unnamed protein product [Rotaria magnacalcarata]